MELVVWIGIPFLFLMAGLLLKLRPTARLSPIPLLGLLVVLSGAVLGHEFFNIPSGPIPITIDRLLLLAGVGLFAFYLLTNRETLAPLNALDISIIILIAVIGVSTITHDWQYLKKMPASRLLFFNILPVVLYVMLRTCRLRVNDLKLIALTFSVFGVYLALTAVAEVKGVTAAVFPKYIMTSETIEFLGRGRGPFVNPVSNGIFMIICLCCTLMWWPRLQSRRFLVCAVALVLCVGCYATLTRSIWLSLVVACGIFIFLPSSRQSKGAMVILGTVACIALFPVLADKVFSFKRDKEVTASQMAISAQMRPMFFYVATKMFQDRPVFGVGYGQYPQAKWPYLKDPNSGRPLMITKGLMQHNVFLAYLTETGLVGLSSLTMMLLMMLFTSWKVWKDKTINLWARQFGLLGVVMLSCYTVNGMFHDVSIIPMNHVFLFFLIGLVNNIFSNAHAFATKEAEMVSSKPADRETSSIAGNVSAFPA